MEPHDEGIQNIEQNRQEQAHQAKFSLDQNLKLTFINRFLSFFINPV
jgi:hypothetical protein